MSPVAPNGRIAQEIGSCSLPPRTPAGLGGDRPQRAKTVSVIGPNRYFPDQRRTARAAVRLWRNASPHRPEDLGTAGGRRQCPRSWTEWSSLASIRSTLPTSMGRALLPNGQFAIRDTPRPYPDGLVIATKGGMTRAAPPRARILRIGTNGTPARVRAAVEETDSLISAIEDDRPLSAAPDRSGGAGRGRRWAHSRNCGTLARSVISACSQAESVEDRAGPRGGRDPRQRPEHLQCDDADL